MRKSPYMVVLVLLLPSIAYGQQVRRMFKSPSGVPVAVGAVHQGGTLYMAHLENGAWVAEDLPVKLVEPEATITALGYGADGARYIVFDELYKKRKRGGMLLHTG